MRFTYPYLLLLWLLLASCYGDSTWDLVPEDSIPPRTDSGADILVCMVNNNMDLQVYREIPTIMPGAEEVYILKNFAYPTLGKEAGYIISAHRQSDGEPRFDIRMQLNVEKPELNKFYKLADNDDNGAAYQTDDLITRREYRLDTNASHILFSRLDSLVAAGEFAFKAFNNRHDTVLLRGYFDIPFER